jgi:two-component system cell cycle response regulator
MRILIADDDPTSLLVLKTLIEKYGHDVVMTINGMEAWQVMQQPDAPRMAILDWMMPEMDGMEACRRIRALDTDLPPHIIMLTARGGKADIIAGLEAGADDYLAKPFDAGELGARINVGCRLIEMQNKLLEAKNALDHEARHDSLTSILNRRAILEALSREVALQQREPSGLAVGICDLDHFKKINDAHGHHVGDDVLCGVVRLFESSLRQYDYLGRLGGEEFAVIAPNINGDDVMELYERLRAVVAGSSLPTRQGNLSITVSIGVAIWREQTTKNALLAAADAALYAAKNKGRNCVCFEGD